MTYRPSSHSMRGGLSATVWWLAVILAALSLPVLAQSPGGSQESASQAKNAQGASRTKQVDKQTGKQNSKKTDSSKIPEPLTEYMGRRIAQTMHFQGAPWLIRKTREREENASRMRQELRLKPGMVVCDLGCGNGYHTLPMARMVGSTGRVFAVDIQPQMLYMLRQNLEAQGVNNVTPILGSMFDPRLPDNSIDLVLLVDVYHEFSHPERMLKAIHRSLKPTGVVVLTEYRAEDPKVPIKPLHKMTKAQVTKELNANGFDLVREFDGLPWQHLMFFGKAKPGDDRPPGKTP